MPAYQLNTIATLQHDAMSTPDGLLVEPWRNMVKSMAGFLEKPATFFAILIYLGINTLYQILPANSLFR
jgi:hypothetical protein